MWRSSESPPTRHRDSAPFVAYEVLSCLYQPERTEFRTWEMDRARVDAIHNYLRINKSAVGAKEATLETQPTPSN